MILFKKILKYTLFVLASLYLIGVVARVFYLFSRDKTNAEVAKIHATKLTLNDVMGGNLPPDPGANADKTIAGVDANNNGIRDDVELAIFKTYPDSAKTRAVLLQYALALQMEFTEKIINTDTVIAVTQEGDRAYLCIGEILKRDDSNKQIMAQYFSDADKLRSFVKSAQLNTAERVKAEEDFVQKIGSYASLPRICDINYSTLPN